MKTSLEVLPNTPGGATLDVREVRDFLSRKWKLIGWIAAATLLATAWYVYRVTPIYTATAELLMELPREDIIGDERRVMSPRILEPEIVDSQMVVLKSTSLLRTVVKSLDLADDPEFRSPTDTWLESVKGLLGEFWGGEAATSESNAAQFDPVGAAADYLREVMDVSRVGTSNVIEIHVQSADPAKAAKLADAVANAYVDDQVGSRFERARRASGWLNERKDILQRQLALSEKAVEKFKVDHKLLATRQGTITEQQLSELNLALITARAETAEKYSRYQLVRKLMQDGGDVQTIPDVLDSTVVSELRTRLGEMVRARADLASKYGDRHPEVIKVRIAQTEIEHQINGEVARVIGKLRNQYEVARSREESLQASLSSASGQSGIDNQETVQLRELERIAAANRNVYEALLARQRLAEEEQQLVLAEARIISPASIPA
ncbi:MAG: GumC family protein, partial [Nitrospira sp.]